MTENVSNKSLLPAAVAEEFGVPAEITLLPAGFDQKTYRSGDVVLRNLGPEGEAAGIWMSELFDGIKEDGFRVAKPIRAKNGLWIVDGWIAEHFLEGRHATEADLPQVIEAVTKFHEAIAGIPLPEYRKTENTIWDRADSWAWGEIPHDIDPKLYALASELETLKQPISLPDQLIHGDLNLDNVLIAEGLPPAIIDIAPYYHPADFALAVTAYWEGPYKGNREVLDLFSHIPEFKQLLIRAGLRMMLTQQDPQNAQDLEAYTKASQIIKEYVTSR